MKRILTIMAVSLLASLSMANDGGSDVGNSGGGVQINCSGVDGAGRNILISYYNITSPGYGEAYGVLIAKTDSGINTFDTEAGMFGRQGKVEGQGINLKKDLYISGTDVFLNLDKTGRQKYEGSICGPHNNIKIAGVQFGQDDCIQLECTSKGMSKLK